MTSMNRALERAAKAVADELCTEDLVRDFDRDLACAAITAFADPEDEEMVEQVARATFRAGHHPNEDESLVEKMWAEWPQEQRRARDGARAALQRMRDMAAAGVGEDNCHDF